MDIESRPKCRFCEFTIEDGESPAQWRRMFGHVYYAHREEWKRSKAIRREMDWFVHLAKDKDDDDA